MSIEPRPPQSIRFLNADDVDVNYARAALGSLQADALRHQHEELRDWWIIDLRTQRELAEAPDRSHARVHPRTLLRPTSDPDFVSLRRDARGHSSYKHHYASLAVAFGALVDEVLELGHRGPGVVIGCQLGRDRTGVMLDLLLRREGFGPDVRVGVVKSYSRELDSKPGWLIDHLTWRGDRVEDFMRRHEAATAAMVSRVKEERVTE